MRWVGVRLLYERAPAPEQVRLDVPYVEDSPDPAHRLDLFLPAGEGWPMLIFVHGGGWIAGDKGEVVAGAEIYRNIGRFAAAHGIGAAVINYRLQPRVTWREQVADVARAVSWVHGHAKALGGDPDALFLSGHSAGAQLVAYVALNPAPLGELGLSPKILCGVIPVSGAAYDLADETTYELGARRSYYEKRFAAGEPDGVWQREASAMSFLSPDAPPFLLIHGTREWRSLRYQNRLLDHALRRAGVPSRLRVARQTHASMVLALSRDDKLPGREVLATIRGSSCHERQP